MKYSVMQTKCITKKNRTKMENAIKIALKIAVGTILIVAGGKLVNSK